VVTDELVTGVAFENCPYCLRNSLAVDQGQRLQECICCGHVATEDICHYPVGVVCIVPQAGFGGRLYHAPTDAEVAEFDRLAAAGDLDLDESYISRFVDGVLILVRGALPC
jgi:hypothetical protein